MSITKFRTVLGTQGPPGAQGTTGTPGTIGGVFVFTQAVASSSWSVVHNLGFHPGGVHVEDNGGGEQIGEVTRIDDNNLTIDFNVSFSGKAYLS